MAKRNTGGVRKRGTVWWLYYWVDGKRIDESTQQGDEREARSMLAQRRREIRDGVWQPKDSRKPLTVGEYAEQWIPRRYAGGVRTANDEEWRLRTWILPRLSGRPLGDVTRSEIREVMAIMQATPNPRTGRPFAPRTVIHVYAVVRLLFADAVADELIASSPCTLRSRRGELPAIRDADPRWRAQAVYTRSEAESLISDPRIPADRRVYYALQLMTGMRAAETAARRWRDYDREAEPLGRLHIHSQAVQGQELPTKTGSVREAPVHPTLAKLLAEWRLSGFALVFGRHPTPDDFIVPNRHDGRTPRGKKQLVRLHEDLDRLGLRSEGRGRHALRATFLTLLQSDGANMGIATRVTHKAPSDVVSGYLRVSWQDLCREIAKLKLQMQLHADVVPIKRAVSGSHRDSDRDSRQKRGRSPVKSAGEECLAVRPSLSAVRHGERSY